MNTLRARVVSVRPRQDGLFSVVLGTGRREHILWFFSDDPPRLGELIQVDNPELKHTNIDRDGTKIVVSTIDDGDIKVVPDQFSRRLVSNVWMHRVNSVMRRPLYSYQAEGSAWISSNLYSGNGVILADEPGTGKTAQTIAALAATGAFPAIVICPASVKHNWVKEMTYCQFPLQCHVLSGGRGFIPPSHVIVANYEIMKPREQQLLRLGAKTIIFDEGHRLKEPYPASSHRAAVATRLAHHIKRPIILTGSPLLNRPEDLWRLLHIVAPIQWKSFANFKKRYCTKPDQEEKDKVKAIITKRATVKYLKELQALVDPVMLRRERSRVLRDLPPKSRRSIFVSLEPYDRHNYDQVEKDVVLWLKSIGSDRRAMNAARAVAIVKLNMLRRIAAIGKLRRAIPEYLLAWFNQRNAPPLVIFAYHREVLRGVNIICQKLRLRVASISGNDPPNKRQAQVDMFMAGKAHVFIAPIESAGLGINLQRASDVLFLERLWTPALMSQAEGRVERIGQTRPTTSTYLDAANTIDEYIAEVLNSKQRIIDRVIDDKSFKDDIQEIGAIDEVIRRMRG